MDIGTFWVLVIFVGLPILGIFCAICYSAGFDQGRLYEWEREREQKK